VAEIGDNHDAYSTGSPIRSSAVTEGSAGGRLDPRHHNRDLPSPRQRDGVMTILNVLSGRAVVRSHSLNAAARDARWSILYR